MSDYAFVLIVGHSKQNAKNIRAWLDAHPKVDAREVVADYKARGYLTAEDARELLK